MARKPKFTLPRAARHRATVARVPLLLTSDTHVPHRARRLPDELLAHVEETAIVVHAGD
ncbi:hypothetical protein JJV70_16330 [Streptomyces sp. JJ66]|nr:hypothetical protein [Streptomyces sp. JJ66]MBW1603644.1 hypothetical protein [Streptomyces sp. JJ66]